MRKKKRIDGGEGRLPIFFNWGEVGHVLQFVPKHSLSMGIAIVLSLS
jgi:hypothetical protein